MQPTTLQIIKVQLEGIKDTLIGASERQKSNQVSLTVANDFNKLLQKVVDEYPDIKEALPEPIPFHRQLQINGLAAVSFLDLEVKANQVIKVIELLESGH